MKIPKVIELLSLFDDDIDIDSVIINGDALQVNALNLSGYIECPNGLIIYEVKKEND